MRDLLEIAPCGLLAFSDESVVLRANRLLEELLEYPHGELIGKRVDLVLSVGGRIFYQTHLFPLLRLHNKVDEIYLSLKTRHGNELPVLLNATREHDGDRAINVCVLIPIRQRNQYEDEILKAKRAAEDATRAKDEFLASVSHELRTPLNAILGWTTLLRSGKLDGDNYLRALETIERSVKVQAHLIEDILDFSRIVAGKLRLHMTGVNPVAVITSALDVVRPTAEAKNIAIDTSLLDCDAVQVLGDFDRLQQVLWNVLSNAIKFTPRDGRVEVRLRRADSHIEISVTDTGRGIAPEFLPYVFDRFQQADRSTKRNSGLGLGMAITRHIVELHGGVIRAYSAGEGQGATFTLELPLAAQVAEKTDRSP